MHVLAAIGFWYFIIKAISSAVYMLTDEKMSARIGNFIGLIISLSMIYFFLNLKF